MLSRRWFEPSPNRPWTRIDRATARDARRRLLLAPCAWAVATSIGAQPQARPRRIGILGNVRPAPTVPSPLHLLVGSLRDLGWVEGRTVTFEYRWAEQRYERFPELAQNYRVADTLPSGGFFNVRAAAGRAISVYVPK